MLKFSKKGFTLAEVLVAMAVIGVIAALTITILMQSAEDTKNRASAKKAQAQLVAVMNQMNADLDLPNFSATGTGTDVRDKFCEYLNCIRTGEATEFFGSYYKWYNNTIGEDFSSDTTKSALLNNKMALKFINNSNSCSTTENFLDNVCGEIYVDINGSQSPNMGGKDYLAFWIVRNAEKDYYRILPKGLFDDGKICVSSSDSWDTSEGCTSYYVRNLDLP